MKKPIRLCLIEDDEIFSWAQTVLPAPPPFVFITGYGTVDQAVGLIKLGARDYVTKPFDLDALIQKIRQWVPEAAGVDPEHCQLGVSAAMQRIAASLPRIAQAASSVLIIGESGVGKEWVAKAIHAARPKARSGPFIAINCGAIPENLIEAELFGFEKGAFTGAARTKPGVFEQAHGGTLFLDEIGEMPLSMQVKLLRVLQERKVVRVGGESAIPVDLLLVCATHRDLKKLAGEGHFREDLYYRINVLQIKVPPLRERPEDIPWFAEQFLAEISARSGEARRLHPAAEAALLAYPWPGNVRELQHAIERAAILVSGALIPASALFSESSDLQEFDPAAGDDGAASLNEHLRHCERRYIVAALADQHWQIAQTAERLGISRKNLWEKMRKLNIEVDNERK
ncbi:MAG TPA: sigma-54 dependent transcriptional regulator [Rhodocyclaceae bacterium]|nr:sigma-54 dependent transcriptional regulator [Rhodocyclaceae bacterium]